MSDPFAQKIVTIADYLRQYDSLTLWTGVRNTSSPRPRHWGKGPSCPPPFNVSWKEESQPIFQIHLLINNLTLDKWFTPSFMEFYTIISFFLSRYNILFYTKLRNPNIITVHNFMPFLGLKLPHVYLMTLLLSDLWKFLPKESS